MRPSLRLRLGPFRKPLRAARRFLPELNFITLHYLYFIGLSLFSAIVFWGSSTPKFDVSFIDALFLTSSAMTEAGLNTINLSTLNTFQQLMLFALILMGSAIFVSIFIVFVRVKAFERQFKEVIRKRSEVKQLRRQGNISRTKSFFAKDNEGVESKLVVDKNRSTAWATTNREKAPVNDSDEMRSGPSPSQPPEDASYNTADQADASGVRLDDSPKRGRTVLPLIRSSQPQSPDEDRIAFRSDTVFNRSAHNVPEPMRHSFFSFTGVGATASSSLRARSTSASSPKLVRTGTLSGAVGKPTDAWFPSSGSLSRNSHFHGLSVEDRKHLGGMEYSAVLFLSFLVPIYFFVWQLLGCLSLGAWVTAHRASTARANGIDPFWVGAFNAVSAFNNSGMSLLDANMVAFQDSIFMLISMGLFILAGNTAYPIVLRGAVWTMWKILPDNDDYWKDDRDTLRFLLDHPRRCYTNMFPAQHTWWLGLALITLNGIDWAAFGILNIGNTQITSLSTGIEILDGLFQALAVRSGGFYVVPIPNIRISLQVLYVVMMYISAYPVVITMRNSNVYEERSLGIFAEDEDNSNEHVNTKMPPAGVGRLPRIKKKLTGMTVAPQREHRSYFVRQQLRAQLAHDAWWIALAVFLIMIIENSQFDANPTVFSVFNVIFEVVSGYGCVGISVGLPDQAYSFCGSWHTLSKLVLIAVMIRGRHRGLPVAIDHAVQLPSTNLADAEEEDGRLRMERTMSMRTGIV